MRISDWSSDVCSSDLILTSAGLLDRVEPEIAWNYLGQYPGAPEQETPWQAPPDADPLGSNGSDAMPLPYSLMVNALVREDALGVRITWPAAQHGRASWGERVGSSLYISDVVGS